MEFKPVTITLKDGRKAILRSPVRDDARELVDYLYATCTETPFLMRAPQEAECTLEEEEAFIESVVSDANHLMILCEMEGCVAGTCDLRFNSRIKTRHRASMGIALRRDYWGLGIGTAMMTQLIALARGREGVIQLELEYLEGNARARALYEKMGFRIVSMMPDAIRQTDGTFINEYCMMLKLD